MSHHVTNIPTLQFEANVYLLSTSSKNIAAAENISIRKIFMQQELQFQRSNVGNCLLKTFKYVRCTCWILPFLGRGLSMNLLVLLHVLEFVQSSLQLQSVILWLWKYRWMCCYISPGLMVHKTRYNIDDFIQCYCFRFLLACRTYFHNSSMWKQLSLTVMCCH